MILLGLILLALVGVLITLNPAFEQERDELVVPMLQWVTGWMKAGHIGLGWFGWIGISFVVITMILGLLTTRHGRWVQRKVKQSVSAGEKRLDGKRKKQEKKKGKKGEKEKEEGEDEGEDAGEEEDDQ